jgi:D-glycero-alpha-D-manno-heptose-7-phosphate kinase
MIISRTPLRISLVGGGSDLPEHYRKSAGAVVAMAVTLYMYVTVHRRFDDTLRVAYNKLEIVDRVDDLQHDLIREALRMVGIERGVEITTIADVPGGTGLGSSSSVTVGVLNALYAHRGLSVRSAELARRAAAIELEVLGRPIGRQDQFIAAGGGLRHLVFHRDDRIESRPLRLGPPDLRRLTGSLLLFYTGVERDANVILADVKRAIAADPDRRQALDALVQSAHTLAARIEGGDFSTLGEALTESWATKRRLSPLVTNPRLETLHAAALAAGASGAKILGAGGGGFLLAAARPERREAVTAALARMGLRRIPFEIARRGSAIIFPFRREHRRPRGREPAE